MGIRISGDDVTIENVIISNCGTGIYVEGALGTWIGNSTISHSNHIGVQSHYTSSEGVIFTLLDIAPFTF